MRCYSCSMFPGSHQTMCPGPYHEVDDGVACTVRQLSDKTVVYQGNVPKASGCSEEMVQHYNFLTDKMFRLGNSRSACCDWDLCNLTWETANMTETQYQDLQEEKVFEENSTLAAAVAGGVALVVWCLMFAVLLYKKNKSQPAAPEPRDPELTGGTEEVKQNVYELQIPDSPGPPLVKPKRNVVAAPKKSVAPVVKKSVKDFCVQAVGLNNQSNQTETFQDNSLKDEIEQLKGKIEAMRAPSKIPRKKGSSDLFQEKQPRFKTPHSQSGTQTSQPLQSTGTQSVSSSSTSIQTYPGVNTSTEPTKLYVDTSTDPMSLKRRRKVTEQTEETGGQFISAATSPLVTDSATSLQSESSPPSSLIAPAEEVAVRHSPLPVVTPPPVVVSSPTPPLQPTSNTSTPQLQEEDRFDSFNNESIAESEPEPEPEPEPDDEDELATANIKQAKVFRDSRPSVDKSFSLCVDSVRMMPDNAVACRIKGNILNLPRKEESSSFSLYPELNWPHRSPRTSFIQTFNEAKQEFDKRVLLLLFLYTVDRTTTKASYLGYSLLELLRNGKLRGGGYKLPVYSGKPKPSKGSSLSNLKESDAPVSSILPATTISIRILSPESSFKPRPTHKSGFYDELDHKADNREKKLLKHYFSIRDYNQNLENFAGELKSADSTVEDWIKKMLENCNNNSIDYNFRLFNLNDKKSGVKIRIEGALGLPFVFVENFIQCTLEVVGPSVKKLRKELTKKVAIDSYQKYPKWLDGTFHLLPGTTEKNTALLIKLYGIFCNKLVLDKKTLQFSFDKNKEVKLSADKPLAWTVCPLFTADCVEAGHHVLPLFTGAPSEAFLKLMASRGPSPVLLKFALAKSVIKPLKTPGVLKVSLYDGLYSEKELFPQMTQEDERLLEPLGIKQKYRDLVPDGPKVSQLMVESFKEQNIPSPTNIQIKKAYDSFETIMNRKFLKLLEN